MKSLFRTAGLAAFVALASTTAFSQTYPAKPIRMVVPFPPGGTTDVLARAVSTKLSQSLGQSVIIDNRPGAGATLGADMVAKAAPDGYTLLMGAVHHTIAPAVYKKLPYDFQKDLAPVTVVAVVPNVLVVAPSFPANTTKELIAYAKANPGKLSYGSNGNGTAHHLIGEQFKAATGIDLLHVPYRGSAPALTDLIAGQISMMFDTVSSALPYIKSGKLKAIAVATAARSSALPDVPTIAESAIPGFDIASWFGVLAPAGTPPEIVNRLHAEIKKTLAMPDVQKQFATIGAEPIGNTPQQMAAQIRDEIGKFDKLAKQARLTVD